MLRLSTIAALSGLFALTACADPALTQRVNDLETKFAELEKKVAEAPAAAAKAPNAPSAEDEAAIALYREASTLMRENKSEEAKAKLQEIMDKYKGSRVATAAERQMAELSVVGKDIGTLEVEEWYQGNTSLADGKATMVVFWEVWCPHCKREVPKLQATYDKFKGQGLNVVGLTKLTRGKTVDDVKAFISEEKVGYPMGKESGAMSDFFGVSGVPAAAVVRDGKVVWRGHPAQVNDEMIAEWIKG